MARVGSINYQVSKIIKEHNGIGKSKLEARNSSGEIAESGHKVSDKFHSYKSLDNARNDLTNLAKYAKSEYGIKDMSKINQEVVGSWIRSKDIGYNTASNYLSEINKVHEHLSINKEHVKELRAELKTELHSPTLGTRAYKNLESVKVPLRSDIAFKLQRDYGLRLREATHVKESQLSGNNLSVNGKGGKEITKELKPADAQQLRNAIRENSGIYKVNQKTYSRDVQTGIEATGQEYNGTHGIRHSYAQNQLINGATKQEVSEAMGHVREEITNIYLR